MKTIIAAVGSALVALGAATCTEADTVVSITQYSYDYFNRPICTAVRMNMAVSQPADPCTPSTTVGADGPDRISKNVYDAAGQLLAVYQGVGTSSIRQYAYYNYTNNGLKTFEIDANHNNTTFTYDGFDRLSKVQYPNTTAGNEISSTTDYETFGYDANSNRTSYRHRNAQTVLYTYDNLNREIVKDLPAYAGSTATAKDIYTGYDGLGHIVYKRFSSASGAGVSYAYDGLGRVSSTTDINNRTVWYGYFTDSTRYYLQFPDSVIQGYTYDNKGALIATSSGAVGLGIAYNSLGKTVAITRSNSAGSYYAYDNVGRLSILRLEFAGTANDITWSLNAYNAASQITNWNASTAVYDYVESATDQTNKTYDGLNRDAAIAAVSGGYDTAGNMANDGVRTFSYDVENRLITGASALTAMALNYDPEGRLYSYSYNGSTTSFLYDGTNLIGEYDGTGAMTRRYLHTLGTDQPWVQFTGSAVGTANATYLYSNYQGSIIATADLNGNVTDLFKYGPYGEPRNSANAESWTGNRFRYTGQTVIPEAKLYYYKARVYDPVAGRFLQTDPIGSADDLDLYSYVRGDPINASDPTGLDTDQSGNFTGPQGCNSTENDCVPEITVSPKAGHAREMAANLEREYIWRSTRPFEPQGIYGQCRPGDMSCMQGAFYGLYAENSRRNAWVATPVLLAGAGQTLLAGPLFFSNMGSVDTGWGVYAGPYSMYDTSITSAGSSYLNVQTNVGATEFQANLQSNGYNVVRQTAGTNGPVTVLRGGNNTWTIYTRTSTGSSGAQYSGGIKYSLGGP